MNLLEFCILFCLGINAEIGILTCYQNSCFTDREMFWFTDREMFWFTDREMFWFTDKYMFWFTVKYMFWFTYKEYGLIHRKGSYFESHIGNMFSFTDKIKFWFTYMENGKILHLIILVSSFSFTMQIYLIVFHVLINLSHIMTYMYLTNELNLHGRKCFTQKCIY